MTAEEREHLIFQLFNRVFYSMEYLQSLSDSELETLYKERVANG